ncbi:SGNH hydrolase-type esterase domain containing protein [Parasponia andersonii]|uniref:SGNH hydrolase-type esterase domain containing protein n=1 Tax=Parasponia andersonii TaxID=3476 RepID=A0A2P5DJE7_PARAD|nr:SGNH hydrolase-type esterase domain containing protein [Parasponia andersonii]
MQYYYSQFCFRRFSNFVTIFIILFLILLGRGGRGTAKAAARLRRNERILAIQAFGNSFLDTGNNNNLISITYKCNVPPYGRDFLGGISTGRFSNGIVISDLIGIYH